MSLDVYLEKDGVTVYDGNITHNLGRMADAAGCYYAVWRPEDAGITHAKSMIPILRNSLDALRLNPKPFREYDAENGWGRHEHLVKFLEEYLWACLKWPDATIEVSR